MPTDDSNKYDPIKHKQIFVLSNAVFIIALLIACMFEAGFIFRVWIRPRQPVDAVIAPCTQFMVLAPAFLILFLRLMTGKKMKKGEIGPSFASGLSLNLGILLMIVYMAFMQLMTFVPH